MSSHPENPSSSPAGPALATPPSFVSQQVRDARRFYLFEKHPRADQLTVVCGGWEECAADYAIDRTTFPYFAVEFVSSGEGELVLGRQRHALQAGSVFSYGPGVAHRIRTSPERRLRKYFLDFTGPGAAGLLRRCGLAPGTAVQIANSPEVQIGLDTLIRMGTWRHSGVARMTALQAELVLLLIRHGAQPASPDARRAFATFERCRRVIDAEFLQLRNVQEAARRCHVNGSHLSRLFQTFCGVAPLRYIHQLQMQWAAQRLHASDALVREVADELGLDPFHFSRMFKRIHGLSPSAFVSTRGATP